MNHPNARNLMRKIFIAHPLPKAKKRTTLSDHCDGINTEKETIKPKSISKNSAIIDLQINCNAFKAERENYTMDSKNPTPITRESSNSLNKQETDSGTDPETVPSLLLRKETCTELRQLEHAQKQLENSMYSLLNLTKELRKHEIKYGPTPEIDKQRRVEITKILQTLRLQKKNSEKQSELLRTEISTITRNLLEIQKRSQIISQENINLKAKFIEHGINNQNLQPHKIRTDSHICYTSDKEYDNTKLQRLREEIRKCMADNEFLKEYVKKLVHDLKEKSEQCETEKTTCNKMRQQIEKIGQIDPMILKEMFSNNATGGLDVIGDQRYNIDFDQLQIKNTELFREYEHLKRLYFFENEQRKNLANELQEIQGNIRVMCRCRPSENPCQFNFISTNKIILQDSNMLASWKNDSGELTLNRVFSPSASQLEVFDEIKSLISSCIDGYNVCLMAYGPTGSGKTFTMQGVRTDPGMTVLAVHELCELCQKMRGPWTVKTSVSMMEVYNEVIYDLLSKNMNPVRVSDDGVDVRVVDAEVKPALTKPEFLYWIGKGHARRRVAATKLNIGSSRSHLVIQIHVEMINSSDFSKRYSTLVFCDLAGSENIERIDATGNRAVETGFINKSLATLGRVFEGLRSHSPVIPYRDSKLTHLLKPCLSGQAKCVVIISVSGEASVYEKNLKAMEFGLKIMQISVGKIKRNIKPNIIASRSSQHNPAGDKSSTQQRIEK